MSGSNGRHLLRNKREIIQGVWLLWLGLGFNAVLSSLGFNWILCQSVLVVFFMAWSGSNVDRKTFWRSLFFTLAEVFFRNFDVAGTARIPDGPVIFACAPHANQFVDGLVVMRAIRSRQIGFLVAAKTMRRKYVGAMARAMNGIPVERAQDVAKIGEGHIVEISSKTTLRGSGTRFSKSVKEKDSVVIFNSNPDGTIGNKKICTLKVVSIKSDTELVVRDDKHALQVVDVLKKGPHRFKVFPRIDQSTVFQSVFKRLADGHAVGIFPEGGSHDRTSLLPLKAGVSIMALGAMCENGRPVTVVPVGINYFKGHRFRSRVFVDIGVPITPSAEMANKYAAGGKAKREACNALLEEILAGLRSVTIQAPDFETLQTLRAMRRLYKPSNAIVSAEERFSLMRSAQRVFSFSLRLSHRVLAIVTHRPHPYSSQIVLRGVPQDEGRRESESPSRAYRRVP